MQPTKKPIVKGTKPKKKPDRRKTNGRRSRPHKQEYGTSKLEERFAKNFLDKLGVKYTYQFKAESIGRYYDFYIESANLIIECDGDYYHSYGLVYEQMSPMQKHNAWVDRVKDEWALAHGIPILRIWEHDINDNPSKVMKMLKEAIGNASEKKEIKDNKKKRH